MFVKMEGMLLDDKFLPGSTISDNITYFRINFIDW